MAIAGESTVDKVSLSRHHLVWCNDIIICDIAVAPAVATHASRSQSINIAIPETPKQGRQCGQSCLHPSLTLTVYASKLQARAPSCPTRDGGNEPPKKAESRRCDTKKELRSMGHPSGLVQLSYCC